VLSRPSYALIATATDYDAWRENEKPVTVAEVIKTLHRNAETSRYAVQFRPTSSGCSHSSTSRLVASSILAELHEAVVNKAVTADIEGSMQYSIITAQNHQRREDKEKLRFILPYFQD
jgi:5'-methylthioadenosine phosphorylase